MIGMLQRGRARLSAEGAWDVVPLDEFTTGFNGAALD